MDIISNYNNGYIQFPHGVALIGARALNVTNVRVEGVTADFLRTVLVFLYDFETLRGLTFLGTCLGVEENLALSGLNCGTSNKSKYFPKSRLRSPRSDFLGLFLAIISFSLSTRSKISMTNEWISIEVISTSDSTIFLNEDNSDNRCSFESV